MYQLNETLTNNRAAQLAKLCTEDMTTIVFTIETYDESHNMDSSYVYGVFAEKDDAKEYATMAINMQKKTWGEENCTVRKMKHGRVMLLNEVEGWYKIYRLQEMMLQ